MEKLPTSKRPTKNTIFSWLCYAGRSIPVMQYIGIAVLTVGLVACSDTPDADLRKFISDTKAKGKSRIPPLPAPQKFEIYTYDDESLRDPFIPAKVVTAEVDDNGIRPDADRVKEVLEEFALGSLKMMGSLEKSGKLWALLKAPDGTLHRTTKGRHVGQNNGRIIKITETELELKEIVPDGLGGWIERFSTLATSE
jgi:type IV pilus assembly protein PilP